MSPHRDVLSAKPLTKEDNLNLIEELKSRGRYCVSSQNYPDALALYSKAIKSLTTILENSKSENELSTDNEQDHIEERFFVYQYKKDMAVLYSNRSLCHLKLNNVDKCYDDAMAATNYDSTYLKGYWRLGQVCTVKSMYASAVKAYEKACELDPNNKTLQKECDRAKFKAQEESDVKILKDLKSKSLPSKNIVKTPLQKTSNTKQHHSELLEKNDCKIGEYNESLRGYKFVNGKKTSYFHHEQTDEEKRIIGDIAPKRVNLPPVNLCTSSEANDDTSAWNTAGTWEERDITNWAVDTLSEQLMSCTYTLPDSSTDPGALMKITKVSMDKDISAHASIATVRGKKRYIYEFSPTVHWEANFRNEKNCTGTITFPDVDGTHEIGERYDVTNYTVESDIPTNFKHLLEKYVRNGGLRDVLEKCLNEWVLYFKEKY